jgi:tetratricopeptide (TPR) repeat protein
MRVVAVLPFTADDIGPEAHDLARWLASDAAGELQVSGIEPRLVLDAVEFSAAALGDAAAQLGAEVALGATLSVAEGKVELSALLADAKGAERGSWSESLPLGAFPQLGRMLARAVLLALGEDASAPPQSVEPEVPAEAVLRLCRAARRIEEGEADDGAEELLALAGEQPAMDAPRRALLHSARAAAGTDRMPAFFSALERLAELRPDDAEVLLALGDYRSLHLDEAGARELYLDAREAAESAALGAQAGGRLAALAEAAGRTDEAIGHLRAAVKLVDDAELFSRLGALLLAKDAQEGLHVLTRATVLAPDDAALHLRLARALREHGGDPGRALAAAARAARLCERDPELADEVRAEIELLLAE